MKREISLIYLLLVLIVAVQAKRWNTKDSVIVDAQYNNEEDDQVHFDENTEKAECTTSDGEPGECVTVIRCHPVLFSEKGQLRNSWLALTYAKSEDVCASKNSVEGSSEKFNSTEDSQIGQKVICCSRDRIQYDLRSEINQDFDTFTTTEGAASTSIAEEQLLFETTARPFSIADDIVIVESEKENSIPSEADAFSITTQPPPLDSEQEAEPEAVPEEIAESVTSRPSAEEVVPVTTTGAGLSVPEPSAEPEFVPEEDVFEPLPTSACPSAESYGAWPVFHDYPWLATIQTRAKTGPTCSGSLITESHVLSAAHCIHRFNSRDVARMQIRIGFSKRSSNDTFNDYYVLRNASKIIFHKRFNEQNQMDNNIALIKLDEPVEFDDHIAPIGVFHGLGGFDVGNCSSAEAGWIKFGNRKVTGISQGVIHFVEAPTSDFHLRESLSRVLNNEECNVQLQNQVNEKMICAKTTAFEEPTVSTDFFRFRHSNDGGPLVVKVGSMIQQIGIKSWAYEGQSYPSVFTRVDKYLTWIRNNLKM